MSAHAYNAALAERECECADPGCRAHIGTSCGKYALLHRLRRFDLAHEPIVHMCVPCEVDALESGVFACA